MKCSRYDAFSDPYLDSKIAILKNKLQAENQNQLDFLEDCLVTLRTAEFLAKGSLPQCFNLAYLKKIHKLLFEEIYDWAGELRICGNKQRRDAFLPARED